MVKVFHYTTGEDHENVPFGVLSGLLIGRYKVCGDQTQEFTYKNERSLIRVSYRGGSGKAINQNS